MMMPSIWGENLFDDFMDFPFDRNFFGKRNFKPEKNIMKTDIQENDENYDLLIEMPGYKKDEVTAHLENGYLTVSANKNESHDEKNEEGKYVLRERFSGSMSRRFYVGEGVTEKDISAKFEDGILKLTVPKNALNLPKQKNYIQIEG